MRLRLEFEDTEVGRRRFLYVWNGLKTGSLMKPEKRTYELMVIESRVRGLLESVSQAEDHHDMFGPDQRKLSAGGGAVVIEQPDLKHLIGCAKQVQWPPVVLGDAIDAIQFASNAPEVQPEAAERRGAPPLPPPPERIKKGG